MKSPHDSPEPLAFLMDGRSNLTEKSSSMGKISGNYLVYKKKQDEYSNNRVEHRRSYSSSSPYYKGLLCHEKVSTQPDSTKTPIAHDVQNLLSPSPYYKGLLYTERVDTGTGTGTDPTFEVETTAPIPHEYLVSPCYKGLLNSATSLDCDSTNASSSSRMKKSQFGFSKFNAKEPPTMVKVYSTENLNEQESGGSEPTSPQFSPPLSIPEPPSEPPLPQPIVLQFDAFGALCILR